MTRRAVGLRNGRPPPGERGRVEPVARPRWGARRKGAVRSVSSPLPPACTATWADRARGARPRSCSTHEQANNLFRDFAAALIGDDADPQIAWGQLFSKRQMARRPIVPRGADRRPPQSSRTRWTRACIRGRERQAARVIQPNAPSASTQRSARAPRPRGARPRRPSADARGALEKVAVKPVESEALAAGRDGVPDDRMAD